MNLAFKFAVIVLTVGVWASPLLAGDQENIPAKQWEACPDGVSVALILTTSVANNSAEDVIKIYVKNTSNVTKGYMIATGDLGFKLFFLNEKGQWRPLRDYDSVTTMKTRGDIPPGQTICYPIALSSSEATLIKSHSVCCHIIVTDLPPPYFIQTRPQILTETVASRSAR